MKRIEKKKQLSIMINDEDFKKLETQTAYEIKLYKEEGITKINEMAASKIVEFLETLDDNSDYSITSGEILKYIDSDKGKRKQLRISLPVSVYDKIIEAWVKIVTSTGKVITSNEIGAYILHYYMEQHKIVKTVINNSVNDIASESV